MKVYIPKHFILEELVDKETFLMYKEKAWEFLDARLLDTIDYLWDYLNAKLGKPTITINNWKWNGDREWSGLRTPKCVIGAKLSQHRFGRAVDMLFKINGKEYDAKKIRKMIIADWLSFPYLTTLENLGPDEKEITWVHLDVRNVDATKGINIING